MAEGSRRTRCRGCHHAYREESIASWHCKECVDARKINRNHLGIRSYLRQQAAIIIQKHTQEYHLSQAHEGILPEQNDVSTILATASADFSTKLEQLTTVRREIAELKAQFDTMATRHLTPPKDRMLIAVQQRYAHLKLLKAEVRRKELQLATWVKSHSLVLRRYKQLHHRVEKLREQLGICQAKRAPPPQVHFEAVRSNGFPLHPPRQDDDEGDFTIVKAEEAMVNQAGDMLADQYAKLRTENPESTADTLDPTASVTWLLQLAQLTKQERVADVLNLFPVTESTICNGSLPRDGSFTARLPSELPVIWQALTRLSQLTLALSHALGLPIIPERLFADEGLAQADMNAELTQAHAKHVSLWHYRLLRQLVQLFVEDGATHATLLKGQPLQDGEQTRILSPLILIAQCCHTTSNPRLGLHQCVIDADINAWLPSEDDFVLV
eukprot:m.50265 g.50265  ORF g.50265 m.50265 type:complete len:441 (+) comp13408_c0_seq2:80-1402(+)